MCNVSLYTLCGGHVMRAKYLLNKVIGCYHIIFQPILRNDLRACWDSGSYSAPLNSQHMLLPTSAGLHRVSAATKGEHLRPLTFNSLNVKSNQKICRPVLQKVIGSIVSYPGKTYKSICQIKLSPNFKARKQNYSMIVNNSKQIKVILVEVNSMPESTLPTRTPAPMSGDVL